MNKIRLRILLQYTMQCQGTKKSGERCKLKVVAGSLCRFHEKQQQCPICQENGYLFQMSCSHSAHLECIRQMVKSECPLCRKEITNLPDNIELEIAANRGEHLKDMEEANFREALAQFGGLPVNLREMELMTALVVLSNNNIPPHLFATSITIPSDAAPGALLRAILSETDKNVREAKERLSQEPPELEE